MQPIGSLPGIGSALVKRLAGRGFYLVGDLLLHLPKRYVDDRVSVPIRQLPADCETRTQGRIVSVERRNSGRKGQVIVVIEHDGARLLLRFFHSPFLLRDARLKPGRELSVRGVADWRGGSWQMLHPRWTVSEQYQPGWLPEYGSVAGLSGPRVATLLDAALQRLSAISSPLDSLLPHLPGFVQALGLIHHMPDEGPDSPQVRQAHERLLLEELLPYLYLMNQKRAQAQIVAEPLTNTHLCQRLLELLPHPLTQAQEQVWGEIQHDLASGRRMHRLLQGDVGAGKTWVAALAMVAAAGNGGQAALMAPTEVLAGQHAGYLEELLKPLGVTVALLHGGMRVGQRRDVLKGLADGEIQAVVGTHALISPDVRFKRLALAVVDEQHRFGVRQRWALAERDRNVHLLAMTATPIPRSLALALYGDMDLSLMQGMPPGRKPVQTTVISPGSQAKLAEGMQRMLDQGANIYWIVPRIDEDEDGASVQQRAAELAKRFPLAGVRGLHGRMLGAEKKAILEAFGRNDCRLLVSTTVVEVGVNVPQARLIVIEQANRYGLAQLHQLRGRVGRSQEQGYCVLIPAEDAGEAAHARLARMRGLHNGLELAELDMQLRGAGDAIGTRQSGEAGFRLLDIVRDARLIQHWHQQYP
ncbi:MAG: ATP-dependent DNA helicase RecG, partial [Mariprofundaceae bacterium]